MTNTIRGNSISQIVENTFIENQYEYIPSFVKILQDTLNEKLDFETLVTINEPDFGQVFFENENNIKSVIDFNVIRK